MPQEKNQQVMMMNSLKRKLSPNVEGNDLQKRSLVTSSPSSSALSLIEEFLIKERSKGEVELLDQHFQFQWWQREHLLIQYLELVAKILLHDKEDDPLKHVLQDIEALGVAILELPHDIEYKYTTIVTNAIQVSNDKENHPDNKNGWVEVNPEPKRGIISAIIDYTVKLLAFLHPNVDPFPANSGNFAPIREETSPTSDLKIKGEIPTSLNGMMIRNGANPQFDPVALYSWIDGDGMLHAISFKEGKATFVSRYVRTSRFKQEKFFKQAEFLKYADLDGKFGLLMSCVQLLRFKLGILDKSYGLSVANTNTIYHSGKLMALIDFDKPYLMNVLPNGDIKTRGINDYMKKLTHSLLPHPKKDPVTGELFIAGASYTPPHAIYNYITKEGRMSNPVPITVSRPTYMHDLEITKNYVIFMDLSYCYDPENMVKHEDYVYMLDICKKPRFGILPKYATCEENIKWFEFENPFHIFHSANSWEEDDDTIVLISCLMKPDIPPNFSVFPHTGETIMRKSKLFFNPAQVYNGPKNDAADEYTSITSPILYKFTFNMKTGEASEEQLSETYCDYAKINENYIGRKSRYVYTSKVDKEYKIPSIIKTDLKWKVEQEIQFGKNIYGSEVVFVPRQSNMSCAEDDGYLTTFVHDEKKDISYAYVIDAQKMEMSAMVELPTRVPYGFHARFVTEEELQAQE